jgi:hypothetical protein
MKDETLKVRYQLQIRRVYMEFTSPWKNVMDSYKPDDLVNERKLYPEVKDENVRYLKITTEVIKV